MNLRQSTEHHITTLEVENRHVSTSLQTSLSQSLAFAHTVQSDVRLCGLCGLSVAKGQHR